MATIDDIRQYFSNILQRSGTEVSDAEINSYVSAVNSGALTLAQARAALINSPEGADVQDVVRLYQVVFGRVPDQAGLNFQVDKLRGPANEQNVAEGLAASPEFSARFGGNTVNTAFINAVYQQVLGRAPAASEVDFYLNSGFSAARIALAFSEAPEFRVRVDGAVTTFLDAAGQGTAVYTGSLITGTPVTGQTFTFTSNAAADTFTGTANNDVFNAPAGTLATGDTAVGGAGTDVLNATLVAGATAQPNLDSVEVLNLTTAAAGGTVNLVSSTGVGTINATGTGALTITNAAKASLTAVNLTNFNAAAAVGVNDLSGTTAAGTAESLSLGLNGTGTAASLALTAGAGTLETLNIASTGATANTITLSGAALQGAAQVVTGATNLELREAAALANGATINGSAHTGVLTANIDFDAGAVTSAVNAANFTGVDAYVIRDTAVTAGDTAVSLFNIAAGSTVRFGTDIAGLSTITVQGSATNTADTLALTLQNVGTTAADVDLTGLTVANVENITINSLGAPTTGAAADQVNAVGTLTATSLQTLTLTGSSQTSVALANVNATQATVTVNGAAATGAINFDGSAVTDSTATGRVFNITGGTAADVLRGSDADAVVNVFTGGAGNDRFNLDVGSTNDRITDFSTGDVLALSPTAAVAGTFVNALGLSAANQATVEGAANVAAAAVAAAGFVGGAALANANEAIAFTYQGNQYIYLDETNAVAGTDSFDVTTDAIVQVTGLTATSTNAGSSFLFVA